MKLEMVVAAQARSYPPRLSAFTRPFWDALAQGQWISTRCQACGHQTFPPKCVCPQCWSSDIAWGSLPATGTLYSWTRIHSAPTAFAAEVPYAAGIVDLDQGPRLSCRLLAPDSGQLAIGARVQMVVLQFQDGPLFAGRVLA